MNISNGEQNRNISRHSAVLRETFHEIVAIFQMKMMKFGKRLRKPRERVSHIKTSRVFGKLYSHSITINPQNFMHYWRYGYVFGSHLELNAIFTCLIPLLFNDFASLKLILRYVYRIIIVMRCALMIAVDIICNPLN